MIPTASTPGFGTWTLAPVSTTLSIDHQLRARYDLRPVVSYMPLCGLVIETICSRSEEPIGSGPIAARSHDIDENFLWRVS